MPVHRFSRRSYLKTFFYSFVCFLLGHFFLHSTHAVRQLYPKAEQSEGGVAKTVLRDHVASCYPEVPQGLVNWQKIQDNTDNNARSEVYCKL